MFNPTKRLFEKIEKKDSYNHIIIVSSIHHSHNLSLTLSSSHSSRTRFVFHFEILGNSSYNTTTAEESEKKSSNENSDYSEMKERIDREEEWRRWLTFLLHLYSMNQMNHWKREEFYSSFSNWLGPQRENRRRIRDKTLNSVRNWENEEIKQVNSSSIS